MEFILKEKEDYKGKGKIIYIVENKCWICIHPKANNGTYMYITRNGKQIYTHRYSYEVYKGKIPNNMQIMHSCDNPKCINPEHLSIGTAKDNAQDKIKKGRAVQSKETKELRSKISKGINNPTAKKPSVYKEIKKKLDNGEKVKDISLNLKVSQELVYQIKRGTHWSLK